MQDITHLEGSPDPGGSPDKRGSPWSTAFLTVQSVSEVPDESVFSRGTQPAEWGVGSGEHAPWHGHSGKHFLEAWVRYCQCWYWQNSSVRFLTLTLRGGETMSRGWKLSLSTGFCNPKSLHNDLSKMKRNRQNSISNESHEQISRQYNWTGCLIFCLHDTQFWLLTEALLRQLPDF